MNIKKPYVSPDIATIPKQYGCLTVCQPLIQVMAWDGGAKALGWTFDARAGE